VRLTWTPTREVTVDAFDMKLHENTTGDEDADFYGLHATYTGIPALTVEGYYYFLRDAGHVETTKLDPVGEWAEGRLGLDQYGATEVHTIGTHLWGKASGFDYDLNFACQFGTLSENVAATSSGLRSSGLVGRPHGCKPGSPRMGRAWPVWGSSTD